MVKNNIEHEELPPMPIAGKDVAKEFKSVCNSQTCKYIYSWLVSIHNFRLEYNIHRTVTNHK